MTHRSNTPAFPHGSNLTDSGITLREYFAGQAMAGLLASQEFSATAAQAADNLDISFYTVCSLSCIKHADDLIMELNND